MSNIAPIAKLVTHVVASVGVSKVVNDIIRNNTEVVNTADAVKVAAGSIVIGSMVAEAASKHVNNRMTAVAAWYTGRKIVEATTE
jgi:hypothetical protein